MISDIYEDGDDCNKKSYTDFSPEFVDLDCACFTLTSRIRNV